MRRRLAFTAVVSMLLLGAPVGAAADPAEVIPPVEAQSIEGIEERPTRHEGSRSQAIASPITFSMVGAEVPSGTDVGDIHVRTSADGTTWSDWQELHLDPSEGPDPDSPEAAAANSQVSEPLWVGEADFVQLHVEQGSTEDVTVHVLDSDGLNRTPLERAADILRASARVGGPQVAEASSKPPIVTRRQWGADESLSGSPSYASTVRFAVVHHTVDSNSYTREQAPALVRGIYHYHTQNLGWSDIGYNMLVDRFGTLYEGRKGGLERAVIGAHAAGYNSGSFGVSYLGNMETASSVPSAALNSLIGALAWKLSLHSVDPLGSVSANGRTIRTISGHRDLGSTACPGGSLYRQMGELRNEVKARIGTAPAGSDGTTDPSPGGNFTDIAGTTHESAIRSILAAGITKGCSSTRYCPGRQVTRAQMASFIFRAMGTLPPGRTQRFPDVPPGHTHFDTVNAIHDAGIMSGHTDGRFRPDEPLTRAQMAVVLREALGLELIWFERFSDVPMADRRYDYIRPRINAIHEAGITNGCSRYLYCPWDSVTRAQMASFLTRAFLK